MEELFMSIRKQIMSVALTTAMVASLPMAAYASDEKLELVVDETAIIYNSSNLGEDKYLYGTEDGDRLLISITDEDIADFAESGKLSYSAIANLNELFGCAEDEFVDYYSNYHFKNGYSLLTKKNDDGIISRYRVYYDGAELSIVDEFESYCSISANGYIAEIIENADSTTINITAPDGTVKSLNYEQELIYFYAFPDGGEDIIIMTLDSSTEITDEDEDITYNECEITMHIINENAEVRDIPLELDGVNYGIGNAYSGQDFTLYEIIYNPFNYAKACIYFNDENKTLVLNNFPESRLYETVIDTDGEIYNDILIVIYTPYDTYVGELTNERAYALIDISQEGKQISDDYSRIYTNDGEIYFAKKADGTWGYLNNNGEELAFFDDAGDFIGDYAPVIKDGKAYLIDRNMNIVSNGIEADGIYTCSENLYVVTKGDEEYFMTFKLNNSATDEPSTDTGKDNPDTGAEGIAAITAIGITAVGAALLSKKKK